MLSRLSLAAFCAALLIVAAPHLSSQPAWAQAAKKAATDDGGTPREFRSRHFIVHTDLSTAEAQDQLKRLETMLELISKYWGRPSSGVIECYIVNDLANWPPGAFDPIGRAKIAEGAGVTISQRLSVGERFIAKAVVYAVADGGVSQHEAVHAYCQQTFGRSGPTWYAEGMAEMGQYWVQGEKHVNIEPGVLEYLQEAEPKTLASLVAPDQGAGDSWQDYAWRWALCHLLANNPNYAPRFRPLGLGLLTGQNVSFEQVYGPMAREISFEYLFFLAHLDNGLRADLIAWDWKRKFSPLRSGSMAVSARVLAARGWQPSGVTVDPGVEYEFSTTGQWQVNPEGPAVDGAGDSEGRGRLVGILMDDFKLGEPFDLGAEGTFKLETGGNLYLRCQDTWNELHDNKGQVTVRIKARL